jgi:hypothetical protein
MPHLSSGNIATSMTATGNMNSPQPVITSLNTGGGEPCRNTVALTRQMKEEPTSPLGQKRTSSEVCVMSALPPKADIVGRRLDVRFHEADNVRSQGWPRQSTKFENVPAQTPMRRPEPASSSPPASTCSRCSNIVGKQLAASPKGFSGSHIGRWRRGEGLKENAPRYEPVVIA